VRFIRQPKYKPDTKYGYQTFEEQTLPDPDSCLTEEQKTWRQYTPPKPDEPAPATPPVEPAAQPSPPADAA